MPSKKEIAPEAAL
jgi:hypothetical protein